MKIHRIVSNQNVGSTNISHTYLLLCTKWATPQWKDLKMAKDSWTWKLVNDQLPEVKSGKACSIKRAAAWEFNVAEGRSGASRKKLKTSNQLKENELQTTVE